MLLTIAIASSLATTTPEAHLVAVKNVPFELEFKTPKKIQQEEPVKLQPPSIPGGQLQNSLMECHLLSQVLKYDGSIVKLVHEIVLCTSKPAYLTALSNNSSYKVIDLEVDPIKNCINYSVDFLVKGVGSGKTKSFQVCPKKEEFDVANFVPEKFEVSPVYTPMNTPAINLDTIVEQ